MNKKEQFILLAIITIIAACGLVYELLAGTLASYVLGDSVTQFSIIIGLYLFSMGIGAYLSKYVRQQQLMDYFVLIEILVGFIGGISTTFLMVLFPLVAQFHVVLFLFVIVTGILVGAEIPLLMRILKESVSFEKLVAQVFSFDYLGALMASIIFPTLMVPLLGISKTALFFGLMNVITAIVTIYLFDKKIQKPRTLKGLSFITLVVLITLMVFSERIISIQESQNYQGKIIYAANSPYQRIVVTKNGNEFSLFLNSNLQFNTQDEHRYHEVLVHPAAEACDTLKKVLILGGGDGMAAREILKYPSVTMITLVDLDKKMTDLFTKHHILKRLNGGSLQNSKVHIKNEDALRWLKETNEKFDLIIVDFPDPSNYALGKLYSQTFYSELKEHCKPYTWCCIQSTSPYVAKNAYWCIDTTLRSVGFNTIPFHNTVPSFGVWGYTLASLQTQYQTKQPLPGGLKFYRKEQFLAMRYFPNDMLATVKLEVNKLNNQFLVHEFEREWNNYMQ